MDTTTGSTQESGQTPQQRPARTGLPRSAKVILWIVGVLVALPVIAVIIILNFDWDRARPWLNDKVSQAIERPFKIAGHLSVKWLKPSSTMRPHDRTWRDWIPWPYLIANDVHVGNPANMDQVDMASVHQFSFSLNPLALLGHEIQIPLLSFDTPAVSLERLPDGRNNWTFKHEQKKSPWTLDLQRVVFSKGTLHYKDAIEKADINANLDTLDNDATYGVSWTVRGSFNGAPVSGGGKAGAVLSLKDQVEPYPIKADMKLGLVSATAEGTLTKPTKLAAIDMRLKASGASMARLYALTGVVFPETPAFSTEGRLLGKLGDGTSEWIYENFKGKVGDSDIGGRIKFEARKPRGMLTANVKSNLLDFKDLGPLVGADSNESKQKRGVDAVQPANKALPVETFRTERWTSVDADVKFLATRIVRHGDLPLSNLDAHLTMTNGVLTLHPMKFNMAGGNVTSNIKLDGSGRQGKNAIKAEANVAASHIKIKQLFPKLAEVKQATVGEINGQAKLTATGNSVATLMADSNGEVKALVSQGTVSKLLLEEMGLNVGNIILTKLFGDKPVELNCLASDMAVSKGVAQTRVFVADTNEAVIHVTGGMNLATEQMDFTMKPETKGLRIFSLRAPIYLRGTFKQPDVSIDKGVLAMKAGGALALGTLAAPLAALVPLVNAGPGEDSPCAQLLAQASAKPKAPPPGKPNGPKK